MGEPKLHPVHRDINDQPFDVFIAGSGPIGATYARLLVHSGFNVCMVEIGDLQDSLHPGAHQKNEIRFQKDIDKFVSIIQGALSTVSSPTHNLVIPNLDPSAYRANTFPPGYNERQQSHNNLGAAAVTRCVGGMSTHWCVVPTPTFLKGVERPKIFENDADDDCEWDKIYHAAKVLIGTSEEEFDSSIRQKIVLDALKQKTEYAGRNVKALPLACHRIHNGRYVRWHAAENIFGKNFFVKTPQSGHGTFRLLANTRCTKLVKHPDTYNIEFVIIRDYIADMKGEPEVDFSIRAKHFSACFSIQILANSGFGAIRDQTNPLMPNLVINCIYRFRMAFCRIVLRQVSQRCLLHSQPEWVRKAVNNHQTEHKADPLPVPFSDPEPQVTIPVSAKFPWHIQIQRDSFSHGQASSLVDSRLVVDLRFFSMQDGRPENRIIFESTKDAYGMPQPTFEYRTTADYALKATEMMNDMTNIASVLGGYLPDSYPQFMTPGLPFHLAGSVRLGHDKSDSVANYNSQVWQIKNLYVAGNGTIPTAFAANPTLTSLALAIRSACKIRDFLKGSSTSSEITVTPDEWLKWTNANDPNYPDHKNLRELQSVVLI
ncbi:hypothetical protein BDP27DRAFT_1233945 [Rhodocollybia butyracea]|uniref:Pyranose 2-oxidase n=1 Tax=Rhodocollybia butyracea TaxID=206335 RepID=A0A9P5PF11_9AGAR|nr:hypothetical protein BDP27DRAFT_1233945 [Rhodocollybia butyracea]